MFLLTEAIFFLDFSISIPDISVFFKKVYSCADTSGFTTVLTHQILSNSCKIN